MVSVHDDRSEGMTTLRQRSLHYPPHLPYFLLLHIFSSPSNSRMRAQCSPLFHSPGQTVELGLVNASQCSMASGCSLGGGRDE